MRRVLVTGASGFIGRHLIDHLSSSSSSYEIFGIIRTSNPPRIGRNVEWITTDLTQPLDYDVLPKQVDVIIHLAQSKLYRQFPEKASDIFDVNIRATLQLLEYARSVKAETFIYTSSGGVEGYKSGQADEGVLHTPLNFYLTSKYCAELLAANYQAFLNIVVLRLFTVYGPSQKGMLIPTLVEKVLRSEPITIQGDPGLQINPIYIKDAIRAFEPAMNLASSALINVAGDEEVSLKDLVKLIKHISKADTEVTHTEEPSLRMIGDNGFMKEALRVRPEITLSEGISKILDSKADGSFHLPVI